MLIGRWPNERPLALRKGARTLRPRESSGGVALRPGNTILRDVRYRGFRNIGTIGGESAT